MGHRHRIRSTYSFVKEYDLLETEIQQLEHLVEDMKADLSELTRERAKTQYSMTWRGRCWNVISHLFSLYCIYRLAVVSDCDTWVVDQLKRVTLLLDLSF